MKELTKLQPAHAEQLVADMAQQAGIPFVWIDPDDARAFADDPKKAEDFRKMLGEKGAVAASKDAQAKVRLVDALNFTRKYSEASGMFSFTPESLSANEALRREQEMKTKQQEVLARVSKNAPVETPVTETPEQTSFEDQFVAKKTQEAQAINLPPDATQEQVDATFESREQAEAYWDRLDREEARLVTGNDDIKDLKAKVEESKLKPLYHGTSTEFETLDPSISGGMVNFAEDRQVADRYAHSAGGGRKQLSSNSEIYIESEDGKSRLDWNPQTKSYDGVWDGEEISIPMREIETFVDNEGVYVKRKSGRIIESSYNPSKTLDITSSVENNNILARILQSLPDNKIAQAILESGKRSTFDPDNALTRNLSGTWWGYSKMSSYERTGVSPTINADFKEITKALQDAGYESLRFNDDGGVTVALFNPTDKRSSIQQIKDLKAKVEMAIASKPSEVDIIQKLQADIATNEDTAGPVRYNDGG